LQKAKTILALYNESQAIRPVLLPWLAFVLKTSIAGQGYGTCKEKRSGWDLNSKFSFITAAL
jgi:hypothetical protein